MSALWRHPYLRLSLAFFAILLAGVQPNWLPLLEDARVAAETSRLTPRSLAAIQDAYARQPWSGARANAAGLAALASRDWPSAIAAFKVAARDSGWTPQLHIAMGDAYEGNQQPGLALSEWQAALPDQMANPALLNRLARAYEADGKYVEASTTLRVLVALQPQNAVARYRFGLVLAVLDPAAAPQHLAIAAGLDKSVEPFAVTLNNAVEAGLKANDKAYLYGVVGYALIGVREYPLAKAALLRAIEQQPGFADAYAYLGLAEDESGNDGTYAFDRALALKPDLSLAHYLLGLHYRRSGKRDQAIKSLQHAFELDPSNAAAAAELGGIYSDIADAINSEIWYRQAVRVAPDDATFWLLLAKFYVNHGLRLDSDALQCAQKAIELAPQSADAYDTLGHAQFLTGDVKSAETNLLKAKALAPRQPSVYLHLGQLYLEANRFAEAKVSLENAVGLDPGGPVAELAFKSLARLGVSAGTGQSPTATAAP
jgi:tetratricopeptide (TPR) repeat protein